MGSQLALFCRRNTSQQDFPDGVGRDMYNVGQERSSRHTDGAIAVASTDYLQLCQYVPSSHIQRVWWNIQAEEKMTDHWDLPSDA